MRKLLALGFLLIIPAVSEAQETYSVALGVGATAQHERDRAAAARQTCTRLVGASTCTQAQACVAAVAVGGASCTAAQARAVNARLYPATLAGREEFLQFEVVVPELRSHFRGAVADEQNAAKVWFLAQNAAAQNAECVKWGLAAGCNPYE